MGCEAEMAAPLRAAESRGLGLLCAVTGSGITGGEGLRPARGLSILNP